MQPIAGNKFGTKMPVPRLGYQQLLNIRFYGLFDVNSGPVLFYVSSVAVKLLTAFTLRCSSKKTLPSKYRTEIAIAIAKYTNENR